LGDERDYNLAILVILLLLCWPAALIYYFTRPMKPTPYPYGAPPYQQPGASTQAPFGGAQVAYCSQCGKQIASTAAFCPFCGGKIV
jgi:hypothetical protein